jgi:hypothetical protein
LPDNNKLPDHGVVLFTHEDQGLDKQEDPRNPDILSDQEHDAEAGEIRRSPIRPQHERTVWNAMSMFGIIEGRQQC